MSTDAQWVTGAAFMPQKRSCPVCVVHVHSDGFLSFAEIISEKPTVFELMCRDEELSRWIFWDMHNEHIEVSCLIRHWLCTASVTSEGSPEATPSLNLKGGFTLAPPVARAKTHNAINSSMLSLWERKTEVPERHQLPVSVYFKPLLFGLRLKVGRVMAAWCVCQCPVSQQQLMPQLILMNSKSIPFPTLGDGQRLHICEVVPRDQPESDLITQKCAAHDQTAWIPIGSAEFELKVPMLSAMPLRRLQLQRQRFSAAATDDQTGIGQATLPRFNQRRLQTGRVQLSSDEHV